MTEIVFARAPRIMPKSCPEPPDFSSDEMLAQRVVARDKGAFELLMRRYNQRLYRAARSIVKNDQDAEEAVQDAYLKAWNGMDTFRAQARLSTWLTRIAINEALARSRKRQRREAILPLASGHSGSTDHDEVNPMPHATPQTPDQLVERADVHRLIERHIDALPDGFRSVFVLRALEDLSVADTARCLQIPEATVRSRFFRARQQLRDSLSCEMDTTIGGAFGFDGLRCDRIVATVLGRLDANEAGRERRSN